MTDTNGRTDATDDSTDATGDATDATAATDDATDATGTRDGSAAPLPPSVATEAARLTRLARRAVDEAAAHAYERERARILAEYGYTTRVREEDDTLVLYPDSWVDGGVVRTERIDDIDRGIELSLSESAAPDADWETVEAHNASLVDAVTTAHGPVHGANARAFADFMGNHYVQRIEAATERQVREFVDEYFPRNAWPSEEQMAVVERSLELLFAEANAELERDGTGGSGS